MRILHAADRVSTAWRNGLGRTTQIAASPDAAGLEAFDWRVSLADIARAGPFSPFPEIDRSLRVVAGRLALAVAHRAPIILTSNSATVSFAGEDAASAEPLDGPVSALNVMVGRGRWRAHVDGLRVEGARRFRVEGETLVAVFLAPGIAASGDHSWPLLKLDAVVLNEGGQVTVSAGGEPLEIVTVELSRPRPMRPEFRLRPRSSSPSA